MRRWARRELDRLLTPPVDPWDFAVEIDYATTHLNRTYGERDAIGGEYAASGWTP